MRNARSVVADIQTDFFSLVHTAFRSDEWRQLVSASPEDSDALLYSGFKRQSLIVTPDGRHFSDLHRRFIVLLRDVRAFWGRRAESLSDALKELRGYKVCLANDYPAADSAAMAIRRWGIYFDTILYIDPLYVSRQQLEYFSELRDEHVIWDAIRLLRCISDLANIRSLAENRNTDHPLLVVVPDAYPEPTSDIHTTARDYLIERGDIVPATENTATNIEFPMLLVAHVVGLTARRPEGFSDALEFFANTRLYTPRAVYSDGSWTRAQERFPSSSDPRAISTLAHNLPDVFASIERVSVNSYSQSADPILNDSVWPLASWFANRHQARSAELSVAIDASAVAAGLSAKTLSFLEAATNEELIAIRESGDLEDLRRALRVERRLVQASDAISAAAGQVESRLMHILDTHDAHVKAHRAIVHKKLRNQTIGFVASGTLSLVSGVFGPLGSLLCSLFGITVGGPSLRDVAASHQSKKELETPEQGSIAILSSIRARQTTASGN